MVTVLEEQTALCHNSLICMRIHKAHATRWLSSEHLPLAFKKAHPRCALHFVTSQLPNHLYISQRIFFNKATHASVQQEPHQCYAFTLSHGGSSEYSLQGKEEALAKQTGSTCKGSSEGLGVSVASKSKALLIVRMIFGGKFKCLSVRVHIPEQ